MSFRVQPGNWKLLRIFKQRESNRRNQLHRGQMKLRKQLETRRQTPGRLVIVGCHCHPQLGRAMEGRGAFPELRGVGHLKDKVTAAISVAQERKEDEKYPQLLLFSCLLSVSPIGYRSVTGVTSCPNVRDRGSGRNGAGVIQARTMLYK